MSYPRFEKTIEVNDLKQFRRTLMDAYEPALQIDGFGRALKAAGQLRERELGGGSSWMLNFALNGMQPLRILNARQNLDPSRVDAAVFEAYLHLLQASAEEKISDARDADGLAEAVLGALDELHGYLIAHELVADAYLEVDNAMAARIRSAGAPTEPETNGPTAAAAATTDPPPAAANQRDLALAA
jgi:hypothetical protein